VWQDIEKHHFSCLLVVVTLRYFSSLWLIHATPAATNQMITKVLL
jgi:hypothetical protein